MVNHDEREEVALTTRPGGVPQVTPSGIAETKQSIVLLKGLVHDTLVRDVHYGRIPGTPGDCLYDPGASMIISAFHCYAGERRIIKLEDTDQKIAICVEVPLISMATGQVMGTGVGAASSLETKYRYRWSENPEADGYSGEQLKQLKKRPSKRTSGKTEYRLPNLEHGELLNTLLKMSSKRAEVDAAESLPGVSSVLREMFGSRGRRSEDQGADPWPAFWGEVRRLGYTDKEAYAIWGISSMKGWLSQGKSKEQALDALRQDRGQHPEAEGAEEREEPPPLNDRQRIAASVEALGWDDAKLRDFLQRKCGKEVVTLEQVPDDKLYTLASELADWQEMA